MINSEHHSIESVSHRIYYEMYMQELS
jgi:hypothetical protein